MELVHVIRHKYSNERMSERAIAKELHISRNTVHRYLRDDVVAGTRAKGDAPPSPDRPEQVEAEDTATADPGRETPPSPSRREQVASKILELLNKHKWTPKQRPTSRRVAELLHAQGTVASSRTIRRILSEEKRKKQEVFVPLIYMPGDLAEVDFFEVQVTIAGNTIKAFLFVLRSMASGRDFARIYRWQDTACFLDGHLRAFRHFGARPARILYDNLKAAVKKIVYQSDRVLAPRFASFVAHFPFEPCFARPYTGHDKGGVEARGKGVRLANLSPIPEGDSLEAINLELLQRLDRPFQAEGGDPKRRQSWEEDRAKMHEIPASDYDPSVLSAQTVGRNALVLVAGAAYSVPVAWHGLQATTRRYADKVVIELKGERVEHLRVPSGQRSIWYPHYLPELARKPNALAQVAPVLMQQLGEPFQELWRVLLEKRGRLEAARSFKEVLRLLLSAGVEAARKAVEAGLRKAPPGGPAREAENGQMVLPPSLAGVVVECGGLTHFDVLMGVQ